MSRLDDFLEKNVEGYLFKDLETLKKAKASPPIKVGAAGYPLLIATFAGIELLGGLVSATKFKAYKKGSKYFKRFWRDYLYPDDARRAQAGETVYALARNGLAHAFVVKGNLIVVKEQPELHLVQIGDAVCIDAVQLAEDLAEAYTLRVKTISGEARGRMQERLSDMEEIYLAQAEVALKKLDLPPAPPSYRIDIDKASTTTSDAGVIPWILVALDSTGASGSAFVKQTLPGTAPTLHLPDDEELYPK